MLYNIIADIDTNNENSGTSYMDHIGLFFFFTGCAGISIVVWIFNWVCWINQCCCCDFLHNPVNKRIAWWMSFTFLLGVLACCISACVTVNRFGFAIDGARCAVDRIYYDSKYGQLKTTYPKWEGFTNTTKLLNNIHLFLLKAKDECDNNFELGVSCDNFTGYAENEALTMEKLINVDKFVDNFEDLKNEDNLLGTYHYYSKRLNACLKVLSMIYYCLLLIVVTFAVVSLMFYACLKRQGYLLTFMHVLWNIIRFFMFSFFLYGTAYGIGFLTIRDSIAYVMYVFNQNLYENDPSKLINDGKDYFKFCLGQNSNLKTNTEIFDPIYITSLSDFFTNFNEIKKDKDSEDYFGIKSKIKNLINNPSLSEEFQMSEKEFNDLVERAGREGGLFGSFDCGFLKSNLNLLYTALYDASVESRILSACSLCASFFGAVAIYFFLLVMHHYNNELFFDTGKSIFTGFDGFGGGYKKKSHNQDPAYKKRKLRAEIELTSKNDEQSGYNDVKKNEEEEE